MLKVKNQKALENEVSQSTNREFVIRDLLKSLFNEEVSIAPSEHEISSNQPSFYQLKNDQGIIIGLDLSNFNENQGNYEHFMTLINLSSALRENQLAKGIWRGFYFSEPEEELKGFREYSYEVSGQTICCRKIKVFLPEQFSLFFAGPKDTNQRLSTLDTISLNLAGITISAASFIRLNAGMEIECELPESFSASLNCEGRKLAAVKAALSGNKLTLFVTNLATS